MPRFRQAVPIDDYVLDVLMRDIVGHDQQPAAFLVYLFLCGRAARQRWQPVKASLRMLADETGLSKSAVQSALARLHRRELVETSRSHRTAIPAHRVLRHWRKRSKLGLFFGAHRAPLQFCHATCEAGLTQGHEFPI